jgi:agmatine deiminase
MRMPAEWEPHAATWLAWPHEKSDWPGKFAAIPWLYGEIVARLARVERVRILCQDPVAVRRILTKCHADLSNIDLLEFLTDRSWTRDTCAIFVRGAGGKLIATDWHFNGWAKYDNWQNDDRAPAFAAWSLGIEAVQPTLDGRRIVLEGGSIDVNGRGAMLTTEECLLSDVQARNPGLSRKQMEKVFARYLGVRKVLWLRNGIAGDDTHGHIDDLARFVDPSTVVIAVESDPLDPNFEPLRENLELLREMTDQDENPLTVHTLPMPRPVWFGGQRLPASYANFYVANRLVLVPTYNDPNDRVALNILAHLFPDREVVGIACTDLVLGLGTLHCMTQQEPQA